VNCRPVVCCPTNDALEFLIEVLWRIDQVVYVTRLVPRSGVDQEVNRSVIMRHYGIEKVVSPSQVTEGTLVSAQRIGHLVPSRQVQILGLHRRPQESHPAATVRDGKLSPVLLVGQDCRSGWKGRLARAGMWQENNLVGAETVRYRRVELSKRFS